MAAAGNPRLIHINPQGYPHKSQAVGEKPVVNIRLFRRKAQKNGRFIAESSALVGRVCQPKNEIPCSRSGKFRKCVGRIQFQTSNKFCPMKRMIGRVGSEMFIESSTEETKCLSVALYGGKRERRGRNQSSSSACSSSLSFNVAISISLASSF